MRFLQIILTGVGLLTFFGVERASAAVSVDDDLTMSGVQQAILEKFKNRMLSRLEHDYMKKDIFLVRWLRAENFNIDASEKRLLQTLRWRKENRIDYMDQEDWSYFKNSFGYTVDSVNNDGQPLLIVDQEDWNVRQAILTGRRDRLIRWMVKMLEDATINVRKQQERGFNVTRFTMVNTLENFNLVESGCLQCLSVFVAFTNNYEMHYPNMMDQLILVNTPGIFDTVLGLIKPLMTPGTRDALRLLGTNKKQWQAELLREIPADQLPIALGGRKVEENNETF